jgi:hypothetical protein
MCSPSAGDVRRKCVAILLQWASQCNPPVVWLLLTRKHRSAVARLYVSSIPETFCGGWRAQPARIEAAQVRAAIAASKLKRPSKVYIDVALGTGKVVIGAGASLRPEEIWGLDRADVEFYDKPRGGAPSVGSGCTSDGRADC